MAKKDGQGAPEVSLDSDDNKTSTTDNSGALTGKGAPPEPPAPPSVPAAPPVVAVTEAPDDSVLIVVHETIEPAPRVGDFNCAMEVAPIFKPKETYRVPRNVAMVIVDAKKGAIVRG